MRHLTLRFATHATASAVLSATALLSAAAPTASASANHLGIAALGTDPVRGTSTSSAQPPPTPSADAPVLATGTLANRTNTGDSGPARTADQFAADMAATRVIAYAWPDTRTLASYGKGQSFDIAPIASTTPASDGTFELRVDFSSVPAAFVGRYGEVDIAVHAFGPGMRGESGQTVVEDPGNNRFANADLIEMFANASSERGSDSTSPTTIAPRRTAAVAAPKLQIAMVSSPNTTGASRSVAQDPTDSTVARRNTTSCTEKKLAGWVKHARIGDGVAVGQTTSMYRLKEQRAASFGYAVDVGGDSVGYEQQGTFTRSTGFSWQSQPRRGWVKYAADVQYGKYHEDCGAYDYGSSTPYATWTEDVVRPVKLTGTTPPPAPLKTVFRARHKFCRPQAGGAWWRTSTRGSDYRNSGGVNFKDTIGINLSSSKAYSKDSALGYKIANSRDYALCGSNDFPVSASRIRVIWVDFARTADRGKL